MAFANFSLTTAYTAIITAINTQLTAVASLFKDQTTGDFAGQVRLSTTNKRLEYWTGSAWAALDLSATAIANATNATTAATAANATTHIADVAGAVHGAVSTNTANMIVRRDASGNFSAGTMTGNVTGNVSGSSGSCTGLTATATKLATARTINGVSFDGTANITINAVDATARETAIAAGTALQYWRGDKTWQTMPTSLPANGGTSAACSGNSVTATTAAACSGNAATATKLATPRAINGVSFDGGADITIPALSDAAHLFSTNGYQKLSNGLIIQWGLITCGNNGTQIFPITFPNACVGVHTQEYFAVDSLGRYPKSFTNSSVTMYYGDGGQRYIAIGY